MQAELTRAIKDGFTTDEINRAKSGLMQQRLQTRAQDSALANGWVTYMYLGRTYAWSKQFETHFMALTPAQVNAAFRKAIDPTRLSVVTAGDDAKSKLAIKR